MNFTSDELFYATPGLDRMAHQRVNTEWLASRIETNAARFLLLHQSRNLFLQAENTLSPLHLATHQVQPFLTDGHWAYLGQQEDEHVFVIDTSIHAEQDVLNHLGSASYVFEDLRRAGPLSQRDIASQMAYGRGLMYWHSRHQYCGVCGHKTHMGQAGHVRQCTNPDCAVEHFPRTDPAVIMLVTSGEKCLLAHHGRMREGMYSTLAGFVEPGETLEQAVRREVFEETGIHVGAVTYAGSQPWPFPTSLMVGYYAQAESHEITLDTQELADAQWFHKDDLLAFKSQGKYLPTTDSIARNLINHWLATF